MSFLEDPRLVDHLVDAHAPYWPVQRYMHHPSFVDGARELFDAKIVRPHTVYVNLTLQLPFAQGHGHVDIPAFRVMTARPFP